MNEWIVEDQDTGDKWYKDSRKEAEEAIEEFGDVKNLEIKAPEGEERANITEDNAVVQQGGKTDGGTEVVEPPETAENFEDELPEENSSGLEQLGESLETDPLDVLPGYMITTVDGKPSLNKRGVSVLAYHYDISVTDKETVAYPHETEYESAIVEITVEGKDGRVFVGAGEAHVDETPKHQLLRMAETRAYKRAVIFATGTGIVGYQELMEQLQ